MLDINDNVDFLISVGLIIFQIWWCGTNKSFLVILFYADILKQKDWTFYPLWMNSVHIGMAIKT